MANWEEREYENIMNNVTSIGSSSASILESMESGDFDALSEEKRNEILIEMRDAIDEVLRLIASVEARKTNVASDEQDD